MCDNYFAHLKKSTKPAKYRFDILLETVDRKNKVLMDYNNDMIAIVNAQILINEQDTLANFLKSESNGITEDETQLADAFFALAYKEAGQLALKQLLSRVRGFNCVAMRRSRAFDVLAGLDSFSGLDATILTTTATTALASDFSEPKTSYGEDQATSQKVILHLTSATHRAFLRNLCVEGTATWDITWRVFEPYLGNKTTWDTSLNKIQVFLLGATKRSWRLEGKPADPVKGIPEDW